MYVLCARCPEVAEHFVRGAALSEAGLLVTGSLRHLCVAGAADKPKQEYYTELLTACYVVAYFDAIDIGFFGFRGARVHPTLHY